MSAGNSADKPQFVENQMLTHDSLNNLVEFSAGRTQRVMRALGLGGTVSGVSWQFKDNKIIIEPGFIVFPDGEVAEIKETLTFKAMNTNGYLDNDSSSSAISSSPGQLQVAYKWAKDNHSNGCFTAKANPQKMVLYWRSSPDSSQQKDGISTAILFRPMSFKLNDLESLDINFFSTEINKQIDAYNKLMERVRRLSGFDKMAGIERVEDNLDFFNGCGILGDISFEIAFFARRLWLAFWSLVERNYDGSPSARSVVLNSGLNSGRRLNPATTESLLFEIDLCSKVASASINENIKEVNESQFPEVSPEGVCAFLGGNCISGVFLNNTIKVLKDYCDCNTTAPVEDFFWHADWENSVDFTSYAGVLLDPAQWSKRVFRQQQNGSTPTINLKRIAPGAFDLVQHRCISSYQHKSGVPCLLAERSGNYRVGFLKPYGEW